MSSADAFDATQPAGQRINLDVARKVLATIDAGLVDGLGSPEPGKMCIEAAVCYALGLPHSDDPQCVAPSLRRLKIRLNDSTWSSSEARARGLRRLGLAQLGSAGALDEREFVRRVARLAMRGAAPKAMRAAAGLFRDGAATKDRLLNAADICERGEPNFETARKLRELAKDIRRAVADAVGAEAVAVAVAVAEAVGAEAVAVAEADAEADAEAVAVAFAFAVAVAVAEAEADAGAVKMKFWDAYWKARYKGSASRDAALAEFCEGVVQILIDMSAPGCQWLPLTEAAQP